MRAQSRAAKFRRDLAAAERLAAAFARAFDCADFPAEATLVVPVPMFWWDRHARGVNLVGLLAAALAAKLRIELAADALEQVRPSRPQFSLDAAERRRNVKGLFAARRDLDLDRRDVLLVDDILTTGATADACARVLQHAGARRVHVAALARTQPSG